ncbi:MAG: EamA family transporter [Thermodesulfobacteriota bacterium]
MRSWLTHALIATCLWGLWGLAGKLASRSVSPLSLVILGSTGALLIFPLYVLLFGGQFRFLWRDLNFYWGLIAGVVGSIGGVFYYLALSKGEASRVVAITATYPLVTFVLAFLFLGEPFTLRKCLGILLALVAVALLSE